MPRARLAPVLAALLLLATGGCGSDDGRTELLFFQFKGEAAEFFDSVARDFEAENPDIDVVVDNVPDAETALRTRLVKDDMPDVLTLNANGTFGELASAGVFRDFSGDALLDPVSDSYVDVVEELGAGSAGEVNGVPFAANASGVLYNPDIFAEQGVEVPTTFPELLDAAQTFRDAGVTPIVGMLSDSWTAQAAMAPIVPQTTPDDFFSERFDDEVTFSGGWDEAATKLGELYGYTQPDPLATGYEDGTRTFATGGAAMIVIGSYAIPQIRSFEPDFTVGSFPLPATDDPAQTRLVSGVDVVLTTGVDGDHPEEAQRFLEYLMQPEVVAAYTEAQVAIPCREDLSNDDPALAGLQPAIEEGRVVGFFDHQFIPAIPLGQLLQTFLVTGNEEQFLSQLDEAWDKVAQRRTWGVGAVEA